MQKTIESYDKLVLTNEFKELTSNNKDKPYQDISVLYFPFLIEIKKTFPSPNTVIKLKSGDETTIISFQLFAYRKLFVYENDTYLLYTENIKEMPKETNYMSIFADPCEQEISVIYKYSFTFEER